MSCYSITMNVNAYHYIIMRIRHLGKLGIYLPFFPSLRRTSKRFSLPSIAVGLDIHANEGCIRKNAALE